jgi:uncharacterized protein
MEKKTMVIGASENPERYSNMAVKKLTAYNHPVIAVGNREGKINDVEITKGKPQIEGVNTVSLYLNPNNQKNYYSYILSLKPDRIIFNPGTENPELERLAAEQGIKTMEACTLVMLSTGQF